MSKQFKKKLTRPGIEPGSVPWQGTILPLDHRVFSSTYSFFLPNGSLDGNKKEFMKYVLYYVFPGRPKKESPYGAGAVTIWASSARRVPRNDPNFVRILAWATLRCVIPKNKTRTRRAKLY